MPYPASSIVKSSFYTTQITLKSSISDSTQNNCLLMLFIEKDVPCKDSKSLKKLAIDT